VELLSLMEERMGVSLDDAQVGGETTIEELRALAAGEVGEAAPLVYPRWARSWWCRPLRGLLQAALLLPAIRRLYAIEVHGVDNLRGLSDPVIFVANHNLLLDSAVLIAAMPRTLRHRLAIAAAADLWNSRFWGIVNPLLGNAFPFSREGSIRPSLENLVRVLDEGWHVLIYPEGKLTIGGPMQPFKAGIGMLAAGAHSAIVPTRYVVRVPGRPRHVPWRSRGAVNVYFGTPMRFEADDSYLDIAQRIEEAVAALGARDAVKT
jgi:1-acyl-sn-glycerol-3-phosphate acyltransferase